MRTRLAHHYATLGLDRGCTAEQIQAAYRVLARQHHPDLHPGDPGAVARTQELNAAYEILSHPERRQAYDEELAQPRPTKPSGRSAQIERNLAQEVSLRLADFLRGVSLDVRINDPANPEGPESYPLIVPPGTAPGTRFRLPRAGTFAGGFVQVRVRVLPDFRFKTRGSDLRCDLRIKPERAAQGGPEQLPGVTGGMLRLMIPARVTRGQILRIPNEGLPKSRGGRGDLLVRIQYRPEIRITRSAGR